MKIASIRRRTTIEKSVLLGNEPWTERCMNFSRQTIWERDWTAYLLGRFNEPRHPDSSIPYNILSPAHTHTNRQREKETHTVNPNEPYSLFWTHSQCVFLFLLWLLLLFLGWKCFRFWSKSAIHTRVTQSHWLSLDVVEFFFFTFSSHPVLNVKHKLSLTI